MEGPVGETLDDVFDRIISRPVAAAEGGQLFFQGQDAVAADRAIEKNLAGFGQGVAGFFLIGDGKGADFQDDLAFAAAVFQFVGHGMQDIGRRQAQNDDIGSIGDVFGRGARLAAAFLERRPFFGHGVITDDRKPAVD